MKVAVEWTMCGFVDIDKPTMEEAMDYFEEHSDEIPLPSKMEYVDGSFQLSCNDVEAMEVASRNYEMELQ